MQQLMKQAQRMQQDMVAAQAEIAATQVTGSAGGGLVSVIMAGSGEVLTLTIAPSAVDVDDLETLQDLIVAALRDAKRAVDALTEEKMGPLEGAAGGMGLPGL
jgi:nucleoid-associated protein EbfC